MNIEAEAGENIYGYVQRAKLFAIVGNSEVNCRFNDIEFRVYPTSHEYDTCEIYSLKSELRRLKKQ